MDDGTWQYIWDTSVILGDLKPGKYIVYAVSTPVDRLRYTRGEYATIEIELLPSDIPPRDVSLQPILPVLAMLLFAIAGIIVRRKNNL
jgi:hypothetical protein